MTKTKNQIMDDEEVNEDEVLNESIVQSGSVTTGRIHCLNIIGQVEGHYILSSQNKTTKYEHVMPSLVAIEESEEIKGLLILLNTVGGDVEAGLAIAELISSMSKPSVSLVLGGGHSIGVPLATSATYSFIAPSATMTVHPVRLNGLIVGVPQTFSYFDKMQERIINFVSSNSDVTPERFRELMNSTGGLDIGSVLSGQEAVEEGIINETGGLREALDKLESLIAEKDKEKKKEAAKVKKEHAKKELEKKQKTEENKAKSVQKKSENKNNNQKHQEKKQAENNKPQNSNGSIKNLKNTVTHPKKKEGK